MSDAMIEFLLVAILFDMLILFLMTTHFKPKKTSRDIVKFVYWAIFVIVFIDIFVLAFDVLKLLENNIT